MSDLLIFRNEAGCDASICADLMCGGRVPDHRKIEYVNAASWSLVSVSNKSAPLAGSRIHSDGRWTLAFAGDLIEAQTPPFEQVCMALETKDFAPLRELEGIFAFVAFDAETNRVFAVSDRRGQKPLFYSRTPIGLQASSSPAVLTRLMDSPEFDERWLWENLFFNFPVDSTSFLKGVKRIPSASVLSSSSAEEDVSIVSYAAAFSRGSTLKEGREALEYALTVFSERVPRYFAEQSEIACALTAGWDARTVIALAPDPKTIAAYTYGVPGCSDLDKAKKAADSIGLNHISIPFGRDFVGELPKHALETVFQSSGLQGILRSTLRYAYNTLTEGGGRFPLTVSGIGVDALFRGHLHTPNLVSPDMAKYFSGSPVEVQSQDWKSVVGQDCSRFGTHVSSKLENLERRFGPLGSSAHHLSFSLYPLATHHYCGELAIADNFTTIRVPAWDAELANLAYSVVYSCLSFSQFLPDHQRGGRQEMMLQAYLLKHLAPALSKLPIRGKTPASVLQGELTFQVDRILRGVRRRFRLRNRHESPKPLEDWDAWIFDNNVPFVNDLLKSSDTKVTDFVEQDFVSRVISNRDVRMIGKLLTAEIVIRLVRSGWTRFW